MIDNFSLLNWSAIRTVDTLLTAGVQLRSALPQATCTSSQVLHTHTVSLGATGTMLTCAGGTTQALTHVNDPMLVLQREAHCVTTRLSNCKKTLAARSKQLRGGMQQSRLKNCTQARELAPANPRGAAPRNSAPPLQAVLHLNARNRGASRAASCSSPSTGSTGDAIPCKWRGTSSCQVVAHRHLPVKGCACQVLSGCKHCSQPQHKPTAVHHGSQQY